MKNLRKSIIYGANYNNNKEPKYQVFISYNSKKKVIKFIFEKAKNS